MYSTTDRLKNFHFDLAKLEVLRRFYYICVVSRLIEWTQLRITNSARCAYENLDRN